MVYFDLNIPYTESATPSPTNSTKKSTRLKLLIKSLQLGYTGIAYNRSIRGVMSESDRCSIPLFPLSSLLKISPALSDSVSFRRELLKVPLTTPFRQYTRLTVVVESVAQADAVNRGNPILRSYDVVAVKPLNQIAFEQACLVCEVDLIAIEFSEKLPFRLKQPLVKAAIKRGVYFEITYAGLILDAQLRRQMISGAKLLVDWTRGKNLVITSAAPSVTDLRGPCDVANLLTLLGLSMERAKAAISKNCRSLIGNALRKKQFYKETIRVEVISSNVQSGSKEDAFDDWLKWDPISSGEGDLLLDDMAKSFSASNNVKAIDFVSVVESLSSHGLQIKDMVPILKPASEPAQCDDSVSSAQDTMVPIAVSGVSENLDNLNLLNEQYQTSLYDTASNDQRSSCARSKLLSAEMDDLSHNYTIISGINATADTLTGYCSAENASSQTNNTEEHPSCANRLDACLVNCEDEVDDFQMQSGFLVCGTCADDPPIVHTQRKDTGIDHAHNAAVAVETVTIPENNDSYAFPNDKSKRLNSSDVILDSADVIEKIPIETDKRSNDFACGEAVSLSEDHSSPLINEECKRSNSLDLVVDTPDVMLDEVSCQMDVKHLSKRKREQFMESVSDADSSLATSKQIANETMGGHKQAEDQFNMTYPTVGNFVSGSEKIKRRKSHHSGFFPFKRLWNPVALKKKSRKFKLKQK